MVAHASHTRRRARSGGFTIIELLTVLAVIAVLGTVAAPSFSQMIVNQRAKGAASDLFSMKLVVQPATAIAQHVPARATAVGRASLRPERS